MSRIAFIGGGNMAAAIVRGLIANGAVPKDITIVEPSAEQSARLQAELGVKAAEEAGRACMAADIIVLAVKPQVIPAVATQINAGADLHGKLLISIAAGVTLATLQNLFGEIAIARTMPNTPALLGLGATGLYANRHTTDIQRTEAVKIIEALGICVTVDREDLLDAVTAVSGSGPAYYFLMIEEMIKAGTALGLSPDDAKALTLQTALGAATMAAKGDVRPEELRVRVTSPNGTTHAAIVSMQKNGFGEAISKAMAACHDRAIELGTG